MGDAKKRNWVDIHTRLHEKEGNLDAEVINKREKAGKLVSPGGRNWLAIHEKIQAQILKSKINKGEDIDYKELPWGKALLSAAGNFFPNYAESWGNKAEMLMDYKATAKGLKAVAVGTLKLNTLHAIGKLSGQDEIKIEKFTDKLIEQYPDVFAALSFEDQMGKTFGTEAGFKEAVAEKPYETLETAFSLLVPAGKGVKAFGLPKVGAALETAGAMSGPIQGPKSAVRAVSHQVMKRTGFSKVPQNLQRRALQLGKHLTEERKIELAEISIANGSKVKWVEIAKLDKQIKELETIKNKYIDAVSGPGAPEKLKVKMLFKEFAKKERELLGKSAEDIRGAKKKVKDKITKNQELLGRKDLDTKQVNELKKGLGNEISDWYGATEGKIKNAPPNIQFKKLVVKNSKEFVEKMVPEIPNLDLKLSNKILQKLYPGMKKVSVEELNHLQGSLIEIKRAIRNETDMLRHGDIVEFGPFRKYLTGSFGMAVGAKMVTDDVAKITGAGAIGGTAALTLAIIDRSPRIKSAMAVYLNNLKMHGIKVHPNAAMIRLGLFPEKMKVLSERDKDSF